jgi:hypothetical protein
MHDSSNTEAWMRFSVSSSTSEYAMNCACRLSPPEMDEDVGPVENATTSEDAACTWGTVSAQEPTFSLSEREEFKATTNFAEDVKK